MAATQKKKQQEAPAPQVEARIDRMVDGDYKTKAYASVTIAGAFAVHGLRVIETDKGRFISMPQESYQCRMESGEFNTCKAPWGFRLDGRNLKICEPEAAIVRRIFHEYLSGKNPQEIADSLNASCLTERVWNYKAVDYILQNERYAGLPLLYPGAQTTWHRSHLREGKHQFSGGGQ